MAMTNFIIVRLLPSKPITAAEFEEALSGLTLEAWDRSVNNPSPNVVTGQNDVYIGQAAGVVPAGIPLNYMTATPTVPAHFTQGIIQHLSTPTSSDPAELMSVATAVIIADLGSSHLEYPNSISFDVRFVATRSNNAGTTTVNIPVPNIDYNIQCQSLLLTIDSMEYQAAAASTFLFIPPYPNPEPPDNTAYVTPGPAGLPPSFDELYGAVDKVLSADYPSTAPSMTNLVEPLTIAQCSQVAAEIIYNRWTNPPPVPPGPKGNTLEANLENMYTYPKNLDTVSSDSKSQKWDDLRQQFEGDVRSYYSTNGSDASKLGGYVYAVSAAVWAEYQTYQSISSPQYNTRALLTVPISDDMRRSTKQPASVQTSFSVVLTSSDPTQPTLSGTLSPSFVVPAAYFYALGARYPPQISAMQRFQSAVSASQDQLVSTFQGCIDSGLLIDNRGPVTVGSSSLNSPSTISSVQAAKRLAALSANFTTSPLPQLHIQAKLATEPTSAVAALVTDWLKDESTTDDQALQNFWSGQFGHPNYLMMVVRTLTSSSLPFPGVDDLITTILSQSVTQASDLTNITNVQWQDLFNANPAHLLPPFTLPGSDSQRISAFVTYARKLFVVGFDQGSSSGGGAPSVAAEQLGDVLLEFITNFPTTPNNSGADFDFATALDPTVVVEIDRTIQYVFTTDVRTQDWVRDAIRTIGTLYQMTLLPSLDPTLQFSYMESLYARGFTNAGDVMALSTDQFTSALAGTVAYGRASDIYALINTSTLPYTSVQPVAEPGGPFKPVNPGTLVNCMPLDFLSPLGPVQYLSDLLAAETTPTQTLYSLVDSRRGVVSEIAVTKENLDIQLPVIDLVLESLEFMGTNSTSTGAVNITDITAIKTLLGSHSGTGSVSALIRAVPQLSSPSLSIASPGIYSTLKADFSSYTLPYSQPLDVCRSYLGELCSTRFEAMRHMRKKITELAPLDAASLTAEPADFQSYQWRLPVRFEMALEYLCISMDEYLTLFSGQFPTNQLSTLFGFQQDDGDAWVQSIATLGGFLNATGLNYCDFRDLIGSGFLSAGNSGRKDSAPLLPECPPCCLDNFVLIPEGSEALMGSLLSLIIFIRIWRKLQCHCPPVSMRTLADIAISLGMNQGTSVAPDFVRQLASLMMMVDFFDIPWGHDPSGTSPGYQRTKLLALWAGKGTVEYEWAVDAVLRSVEESAQKEHRCHRSSPEFKKVLKQNLDELSLLAGFSTANPWDAKPTSTIRFMEILRKVYASNFTVGEIIFLFTVAEHPDGDDPFRLPDRADTRDTPLNFPEDDSHGIWELRRKLLDATVCEAEIEALTWNKIDASLRGILGLHSNTAATDLLNTVGEHFFPEELGRQGHQVSLAKRRWITPLSSNSTTVHLWSSDPCWPFHYDPTVDPGDSDFEGILWVKIPLKDTDVSRKLRASRQLNDAESLAVQNLYFAPKATLAPLAFMFDNFHEAVDYLIQEPDESSRFWYFKSNIALFLKRCEVIAEHLSEHVCSVNKCPVCKDNRHTEPHWSRVAERVLRSLIADEDFSSTSWENDAGTAPPESAFTWATFSANAYAGILGLIGTGLLGTFTDFTGNEEWVEIRGPMLSFGPEENRWNTPVLSVIPHLTSSSSPANLDPVLFKNGFILHDHGGNSVEGAQPFVVTWSGTLLIQKEGEYQFFGGQPSSAGEVPWGDDELPTRWLVTLGRRQKTWTLLNKCWPHHVEHASAHESLGVCLKTGAYHVEIKFRQDTCPRGSNQERLCGAETGFEVKYRGPDTGECIQVLHHRRLVTNWKTKALRSRDKKATLFPQMSDSGLLSVDSAAKYLELQYYSTLRDTRRTYERAFKAILFAHRFHLTAWEIECDHESELGFMLDHPDRFQGTCYYQASGSTTWSTHHADFNFNLLPVQDNLGPPGANPDMRSQPSPQRQAALFDWWERIFDYTQLRHEVRTCHDRHAWLLFEEVDQQQPTKLEGALRHINVNLELADAVLTYFDTPLYSVATTDLLDERWANRIWHADKWLIWIQQAFYSDALGKTHPALWASDDPGMIIGTSSGNTDLVQFVQQSFVHSADSDFIALRRLNDGLRCRARDALVSYLCVMQRVPLPFTPTTQYAQSPRDLSDLLLQDVASSVELEVSRIEDAIQATVGLVQRGKLGLEAGWAATFAFEKLWNCRYSSFDMWQAWKRRQVYGENWLQWEEMKKLDKHEGSKLLVEELRRKAINIADPGHSYWWSPTGSILPSQLELTQSRELAMLSLQKSSLFEGLSVLGTPARDARPTLLAPIPVPASSATTAPPADTQPSDTPPVVPKRIANLEGAHVSGSPATISTSRTLKTTALRVEAADSGTSEPPSLEPGLAALQNLPLWVSAAVRLGARFVRVAAGSSPPADPYTPKEDNTSCCKCGGDHDPLVDEYYFWLQDARYFKFLDAGGAISDPIGLGYVQNSDLGAQSLVDPQSDWFTLGDPTQNSTEPTLSTGLMQWPDRPMVHLFWTRVHLGTLDPPRRSTEGLPTDPNAKNIPDLEFSGRSLDTLNFQVVNTIPSQTAQLSSTGASSGTTGGFQYSITDDIASPIFVPPLTTPTAPTLPTPPLAAYPYFIFFSPGKPLMPVSPVGIAMATAEMLKSNCQYDAATLWYRSVFDPTARDNTWALCKKLENNSSTSDSNRASTESVTAPAKSKNGVTEISIALFKPSGSTASTTPAAFEPDTTHDLHSASTKPASSDSKASTSVSVTTSDSTPPQPPLDKTVSEDATSREVARGASRDPPCCPCTATGGAARARAILLEYLETLLRWSDSLLCRNSAEASHEARVILDLIGRLLGSMPPTVQAHDQFTPPMTISTFVASPPPLNPRLLQIYGELEDRRRLVENDENGRRLQKDRGLALWGKNGRFDASLHSISSTGSNNTPCEWDCTSCCQPYRYTALMSKALDWAQRLTTMGNTLLSAFEKGDTEYLSSLRQSQERQLVDLGEETSKNSWRAADWDVQALNQNMESALHRLRYYQGLINGGLNFNESSYVIGTYTAIASRVAAEISHATAAENVQEPDEIVGGAGAYSSPVNLMIIPGTGGKNASTENSTGDMLTMVSEASNMGAGLSSTQGGWDRRTQEWQNEVDVITVEIQQVKRQQLASWRRRQVALKELNTHRTQMEHAAEVETFLHDKFTKHELYLYLQQEAAALYAQNYRLAMKSARQAQQAFWYERADSTKDFLQTVTWDSLHEGFLVGEKLELALHAMDQTYMDLNCRELELMKQFSLRHQFAKQFRLLKTKGYCEIEIPEYMFDLDYPGLYLRRIKNVSMSILCFAGPYTGIHCRLQLLKSSIRYKPLLPGPEECCCPSGTKKAKPKCQKESGKHCRHCEEHKKCKCREPQCKCKARCTPDPYLKTWYSATEAIASSGGVDDNGLFQLDFRDDRYLPFEFSGAVSRWRVELPPDSNQFDFDCISDFILKMNYTAREGGEALRRRARETTACKLPDGGVRFIDVRHDMPDTWRAIQAHCREASWKEGDCEGRRDRGYEVEVCLQRKMFPYLTGRRGVQVERLHIFFEKDDACDEWPCGDHFEVGWRAAGPRADCCCCEEECEREIVCRSGEEGCVYHGCVDLCVPVLHGHGPPLRAGKLCLPRLLGEIRAVYFLFEYKAECRERGCGCRGKGKASCVGCRGGVWDRGVLGREQYY